MADFRFTCPDCGTSALVDGGVRERLLAVGCPVCGRPVGSAAFVDTTSPER